MSEREYVVNFGDDRSSTFVRLAMAEVEIHGAKLREEIVRCRDCRYYEPEGEKRISGAWEVPKPSWCRKLHVSKREPDGFCAWACRKVVRDE